MGFRHTGYIEFYEPTDLPTEIERFVPIVACVECGEEFDPYKPLMPLKAEINEESWATLNSDISRRFSRPDAGRISVKVSII